MESDKGLLSDKQLSKSGFLGLFDVSIQFVYFPRQRSDYVVAWAVRAGGVPTIIPEPASTPKTQFYIYNFIEPIYNYFISTPKILKII